MEGSVSQCKIQSEFSKCTPELLSNIISSQESNIDNEMQMPKGLPAWILVIQTLLFLLIEKDAE